MTNQEIFDKVCTELLTQGMQSASCEGGLCKYRALKLSETGEPVGCLRCAAGILILDKFYTPHLEGSSVPPASKLIRTETEQAVVAALLASGVKEDQLPLVRDLQLAHDDTGNWGNGLLDLKRDLRKVGFRHSLSAAVLG